ncbi:MAG: CRISPR-associated protein Cas4 [Candidatus Omnitrophica bacterium]|nr:CRISPR-associated protein Cas4 [Candidatus Omnitrophota bacterium]
MIDLFESKITGTQVAYYIVCKRKLWLFSHHIEMESFSDSVLIGKLISEESFKREKFKEISIGDTLKIDFLKVDNEIIVHEVKKSKKLEESHIWQVKYYIYRLKNLGLNCFRGVIHYPKIFKKLNVEYEETDTIKIEQALLKIKEIINQEKPPEVINKPYCRKCAYFELCYI